MEKMKVMLLLALLLAGVVNVVFAGFADSSQADTKDLVARIEKLEQQIKAIKTASPFSVSGQILGSYMYSPSGVEKDKNSFDLDRSYITLRGTFADTWKAQITTDLVRGTDSYKGFIVRLKFAYVEYVPTNFSVKLGMIQTPFVGVEEPAWRYRGIAKTATDMYKYFATADLGASIQYTLPAKFGDVVLYVLNGAGYDNPESEKFKDVAVRATITPLVTDELFKTLAVSGFYYNGNDNSKKFGGLTKNRYGALLSYSYKIASVNAEYLSRSDSTSGNPTVSTNGNVVSIFGEIKSPFEEYNQFSLVYRYDKVTPNNDVSALSSDYFIFGLSYKPNEKLAFALDYQPTYYATKTLKMTDNTYTDFDQKIYLHMMLNLQ
jgi:phosphate-selective porin